MARAEAAIGGREIQVAVSDLVASRTTGFIDDAMVEGDEESVAKQKRKSRYSSQ